ncbi:hypothetical protein BV22DRAFT_245528 [Leucogyrophana mollusca]|uniref:Uncharacterized protein n=1 Tax=Leucogyrophana mollusca TaxID=85980 RepID=A0ACB8BRS7_9AGAM|nr:hypothetical protein BV22DRAFT_245528 [Leucogyrophana mollusca]
MSGPIAAIWLLRSPRNRKWHRGSGDCQRRPLVFHPASHFDFGSKDHNYIQHSYHQCDWILGFGSLLSTGKLFRILETAAIPPPLVGYDHYCPLHERPTTACEWRQCRLAKAPITAPFHGTYGIRPLRSRTSDVFHNITKRRCPIDYTTRSWAWARTAANIQICSSIGSPLGLDLTRTYPEGATRFVLGQVTEVEVHLQLGASCHMS